jgi:hypothetical protein
MKAHFFENCYVFKNVSFVVKNLRFTKILKRAIDHEETQKAYVDN